MISLKRPYGNTLFPWNELRANLDLLLDPSFPHREELLQFIWEQRLFDVEGLCTVDGEPIEVLEPGLRQSGSGPDLVGARLRIGGQLWAGSVEVHVRAGEWYAHGHHLDAAYDSVVLHVVWAHDMDIRTASGNCPPTVVLRERVAPERLVLFERLLRSRGWVPCAGGLAGVEREVVDRCLEDMLEERLERKAASIAAAYAQLGHDPAATAYHALLRGFGGPVSADACAMLAHALPLRVLLKVRDDAVRTEALLFGQAGLLEGEFRDDHPRVLQREHHLLARLHGLAPIPGAAWRYGRLRPSAFPSLRLAQFARFIARHGDALVDLVLRAAPEALREAFAVEAASYWNDRSRFDAPAIHAAKRMGSEAIDHLLINAVLPLRLFLGRAFGHPRPLEEARAFLRTLPAEDNAVVRGWRKVGITVRDAAGSQALLELRGNHCGQRRCLTCVIGMELLSEPFR